MIIFYKGLKEIVITLGVFIACCFIIFFAIRAVYTFRIYALPVSVGLILIPLAIYKGWRWGYALARTFYGGWTILLACSTFNPFVLEDLELSKKSYSLFLLEILPFAGLALLLFYCLGEHAKWRGLK
jgi:hypothetical protein